MVFEPFLGLFAGMFRVIVLLKDDVLGGFAVMGQAFLKFVIHNLDEKVPIHPTLNLACIPRPIPKHAAPHHHRPTSKLHCTLYQPITQPSPALFQAHFLPSDPRQLILVSSDHTTLFQSSRVQSLCLIAKSILSFLCLGDKRGFFFFTTAFIPVLLRCWRTVWEVTGWLVIVWSALDTCTAVSAFPEVIRLTACRMLAGESLAG